MRELKDKDTGLSWLIPEGHYPAYKSEDSLLLRDFCQELNQYKSTNITKFVTGDIDALGNYLLYVAKDSKKIPCYAFEDGELVASMIYSPNNKINNIKALEDCIKEYENNPEKMKNMIDYIFYQSAKKLLNEKQSAINSEIDYLVVTPNKQGKGIGSRAVSSIIHNPEFFSSSDNVATINTIIHQDNIASQRTFEKNGFQIYSLENNNDVFDNYIRVL